MELIDQTVKELDFEPGVSTLTVSNTRYEFHHGMGDSSPSFYSLASQSAIESIFRTSSVLEVLPSLFFFDQVFLPLVRQEQLPCGIRTLNEHKYIINILVVAPWLLFDCDAHNKIEI